MTRRFDAPTTPPAVATAPQRAPQQPYATNCSTPCVYRILLIFIVNIQCSIHVFIHLITIYPCISFSIRSHMLRVGVGRSLLNGNLALGGSTQLKTFVQPIFQALVHGRWLFHHSPASQRVVRYEEPCRSELHTSDTRRTGRGAVLAYRQRTISEML